MSLKKKLDLKLNAKEKERIRRGFDIVGDIAIIEVPDELGKKEKLIGKAVLETHKNIKSVFKKKGGHEGTYRLQKLLFVTGEKRTTTIHKENNCSFFLDVGKVYFSPRMATERERIARLVKKGERVLVLFSGLGPFPIVISKNSGANEIVGVEINPQAHKFGLENVRLNKTSNVKLIKGTALNLKKLGKFDRVLMPLPKGAGKFLDSAIPAVKKNGFLHFYDFLPEEEIPRTSIEKIVKACLKFKRKCKLIGSVKCGQLAPRQYRVCIDMRII